MLAAAARAAAQNEFRIAVEELDELSSLHGPEGETSLKFKVISLGNSKFNYLI